MPEGLLVIVGMPGSGKSRVAQAIADATRSPIVVMGDVVRERVKRKKLAPTLENLMREAKEIRREMGPAGVAVLLADKIRSMDERLVIVDGARSVEEVKVMAGAAGCVKVIAVTASPSTRLSRLVKRGREGDPKNMSELVLRDQRELSFGLGNLIALADYTIVNEGGWEELQGQLDRALKVVDKCGDGESVWKYL